MKSKVKIFTLPKAKKKLKKVKNASEKNLKNSLQKTQRPSLKFLIQKLGDFT